MYDTALFTHITSAKVATFVLENVSFVLCSWKESTHIRVQLILKKSVV